MPFFRSSLLFSTAAAVSLLTLSASAATWQWDGGAGTGNWQTAANWAGDTANPNFNGTFADRLNVNGPRALVYTSAEGTTNYGGPGIRGLVIGSGAAGSGTMTITGGTFSTFNTGTAGTVSDVIGNLDNQTGILNIDGGTFIGSAAGTELGLGVGTNRTSTLNVNSGTATITSLVFKSNNSTVNLNLGGVLSVNSMFEGDVGLSPGSTVNFNGGTLKARQNSTTFISTNTDNVVVRNGGAIIDSNGFNIEIAKALTAGSPTGGGLTKQGAGILTLANGNTYTGDTIVKAGTLKLNASTALATSSRIVAGDTGSSGAILDVATAGLIVGSDKTLAGIGTVNATGRTVTLSGTLAPGDGSTGALAISGGSLSMGSTSVFDWDINTTLNTSDSVSVGDSLSVASGAIFKVISNTAFTDPFWDTTRSWDVFGGKDFDAFILNFVANGVPQVAADFATEGAFSFTNGGTDLIWIAVPEPSNAHSVLIGLCFITAGLLRRRR